jgi:DNA-binding NtrC family response regulator
MNSQLTTIAAPDTAVLIVDDNPQYSKVLTHILSRALGYLDVTTFDSLDKAFEAITKSPDRFQLLFVDFRFPKGGTGGEFLERLKRKQLLDNKVAFLITSEPTVENQRQAISAGAAGVVAKPFDRKHLLEQLEKAERSIVADRTDSF